MGNNVETKSYSNNLGFCVITIKYSCKIQNNLFLLNFNIISVVIKIGDMTAPQKQRHPKPWLQDKP